MLWAFGAGGVKGLVFEVCRGFGASHGLLEGMGARGSRLQSNDTYNLELCNT